MSADIRTELRNFISERFISRGDSSGFNDSDSLFISRRLDSLDAVETVMFLEGKYGIDFAKIGFDQTLIDSIDVMIELVKRTQ